MSMTSKPRGSYRRIETPFGPFALIEDAEGRLRATWTTIDESGQLDGLTECRSLRSDLVRRLERYFHGAAVDFSDVSTPDGPAFFRRCWDACRRIPRGEVVSYGELGSRAGSDGRAARAVGQAMRRNPLPIIVPCHRVVASGGRLHGYGGACSGPQLVIKRNLLRLEAALHEEPALIAG